MAGNRDLILAGIAGGGAGGSSLSWFAAKGTTMPTAATGTGSTLNAAFKDGGWVTEDGLRRSVEEQIQQIRAYGSQQPVRTLRTSKEVRFEIGFLESNPVSIALFQQLPLTGTGALVPDASGAFDFVEGPSRVQEYAAVFDIVDGANLIRAVVPVLECTATKEFDVKAGSAIAYGCTFTAYPGSDGTAIHWYYVVDALATP